MFYYSRVQIPFGTPIPLHFIFDFPHLNDYILVCITLCSCSLKNTAIFY